MKNKLLMLLGPLALVIAIAATPASTQQQSKQWEYKFVYQCDERKANSAATDGWELVTLSMASYGNIGVGTCAFKRAK